MRRRHLILSAPALALGARGATAQEARQLTLVVPFAPGGPTDVMARRIAESWRQGVPGRVLVVENRAGAGGNLGAEHVARAAPDGRTLLFGTSGPLAINPLLFRSIAYDPVRDFAPVLSIGRLPNVLLVRPGFADLGSFIAAARRSPPSYGSSGNGATSHLTGAMFSMAAGVEMQHVPYRGTGPALQDLLAGVITATFTDVLTAAPHVAAGTLRALGVTTPERSNVLPDVPTLHEQNFAGFDASVFFGFAAPARTPRETVAALHAEAARTLAEPALRRWLLSQGLIPPADDGPEALGRLMAAERDRWASVITAARVQLD